MIDRINLERILDFYDVPQLFIGIDIIGTRYLCLLYDDESYYRYISIRISENKLKEFLGEKIDLRSLFISPEINNEYFVVSYFEDFYHIEKYNKDIVEEMLPSEGYFFEGNSDDALIIWEANKCNHPVIHLGFEDPINSHSIPVSTLSSLTAHYQSIVANCYKKIDGTKDDRDFRLRVFSCSAASFNVHMYAESSLDLFGSSRIDITLHKVDSLLKCTSNDQLMELLIPLKGHTIRSYRNFIKELIDNKIVVKYKWVSSISESKVISNRVEVSRLEQIYEVLSKSTELEKEIKLFEGIIISSSMTNGKWELKLDTGDKISGKADPPSLLSGVVIGEVRYELKCEEIIEQNNFSSKEKVSFVLIEISEIESVI